MTDLPRDTASDLGKRQAQAAVLPVGSFEQHGSHLPMTTDTLIANAIAAEISAEYELLMLPPVTVSCSHEHTGVGLAVSLRASTLYQVVNDIAESLRRSGVDRLVVVNGHGGNYVLSNVVQEANEHERRMALFPGRSDWATARRAAGLASDQHADMHAGELETSIILHSHPDLVGYDYAGADHSAPDRRHLLTLGMKAYTLTGVVGMPSQATAEKGKLLMESLIDSFSAVLAALAEPST